MLPRVLILSLLLTATPSGPVLSDTLVAATTIPSTTQIQAADLRITPDVTPGALRNPQDAIGLEARVNLYPGRAIRASDLQAAAIIDRNDIVTLHFSARSLLIVTEGRALDRAAMGERFRVLNLSSRATITATATGPGRAHVGIAP